jgi:hypothetical protein
MAYQHYRECRAVSSFPDDGVVRYNASIIRDIEDAVDRTDGQRTIAQVAGISMLGGKK